MRYGILGEHTHGGLAEYVKVEGRHVPELPDAIRYEDAAAFVLVNMTAWRMLVTQARLRAGEDLLILGVGGGVSSTAVQIGKLCGARVWVTSSSDEKLERARALGADECINYAKDDWVKVIGQKTGRRGVDVVLENVGAATWKGAIRTVAKGGRIVTCGATSGPIAETDIRLVFWKQLSIIGSTMSNDAEFNAVMGQLFAGRLRAIVDTVMPLREGVEAQRRLAEGKQFGKIVLTHPPELPAGRHRGLVGGLDGGPARPRATAAGSRGAGPGERPAPRYFRTRPEAEAFIAGLLAAEPGAPSWASTSRSATRPTRASPAGRALCARLHGLIRDGADGANNRFEVAGRLNREIQAAFGGGFDGPFWGHPAGRAYPDLAPKRPRPFPRRISDGRLIERRLAARRIQSPWKLFTRASVGSQTLVGLPAVIACSPTPALAAAGAALALRDRVGSGDRRGQRRHRRALAEPRRLPRSALPHQGRVPGRRGPRLGARPPARSPAPSPGPRPGDGTSASPARSRAGSSRMYECKT